MIDHQASRLHEFDVAQPHDRGLATSPWPAVVPDADAEPRISLILVAHDNASHVDGLATSLHGLHYGNFETILVDVASTDGTADRLSDAYNDLLALEVETANTGYAAACNRGAGVADPLAEYLVFCNCDIELEADALGELVRPMQLDASIGGVMAKLLVLGDEGTLNAASGGSHFLGFSWNEQCMQPDLEPAGQQVQDVGFLCGAAFAVRRTAFEAIDGFDESFFLYMEDVDISWRLRLAGFRTVVAPAARVHHDYRFFALNNGFCRLAERNRLTMVLSTYRLWSLLLLAPLALGVEIVVLGYAAREGWLREKLSAYVAVARHPRRLLRRRRWVQKMRVRGADGRRWTGDLQGVMGSPHLRHPLVRFGNAVLGPVLRSMRGMMS